MCTSLESKTDLAKHRTIPWTIELLKLSSNPSEPAPSTWFGGRAANLVAQLVEAQVHRGTRSDPTGVSVCFALKRL